jgi:protein TonB
MKKFLSLSIFMLFIFSAFSQDIVNMILVGKSGITEDIKEATSFIVIKEFPNYFQRLDYNIGLPLERMRTYSDSNLTILNGIYCEYSSGGVIGLKGIYINNVKEKDWHYYNGSGEIILTMQYENDAVVKTIKQDTIKKEPISKAIKKGEVETSFKRGDADWRDYLRKNLNASLVENTLKGGIVIVNFTVDTTGKCIDIHLDRSAQFILDEEAIRMINNSPLWKPAYQDGKKVNAIRRQPITWAKVE